jgi:hypothetical protein
LIKLLRSLVDLLGEEAARNPAFADRLDTVLQGLSADRSKTAPAQPQRTEQLPDIHSELVARGETDFRLWLRDLPVFTLRAIIRAQDFDSTRRTSKWKETEKLADFIVDSLRARMSKGASFIGRGKGT